MAGGALQEKFFCLQKILSLHAPRARAAQARRDKCEMKMPLRLLLKKLPQSNRLHPAFGKAQGRSGLMSRLNRCHSAFGDAP
jgi:hypothetical protein